MKYTLDGKTINVPDKEITNNMKVLGLTKDEAIQLYLDDNGYTENDEQILLDNSAKEVKINHEARITKERKQTKPRSYVNSDEKNLIVERVRTLLDKIASDVGGNVEVLTKGKLFQIKFPNSDRPIKVDIIQARPPKQ